MTIWTSPETLVTNILPYSEDFTQWSANNGETAGNFVSTDPFGQQGGSLVSDTSTSELGQLFSTVNISGNTTRTFSIFVQKDSITSRVCGIRMSYTGSVAGAIRLNTSTGEIALNTGANVIVVDSGVDDYGDYWRLWIASYKTGVNLVSVGILPSNAVTVSGASDVTLTGSVVVFGAQLEVGVEPTGYIPTDGAAVTSERLTAWARP